jgi:vacuolar-type H+-ATPase subunit H
VPYLRDFLSRSRPAGAPGAARAGVPADRRRELEAELGPVLALLAGTQAECGQIIAQARRDAGQVTAGARAGAAAIAADGERRAAAAHEEAARQVMTAARDEAAAAVRDAERRAARTSELAARRMPALVSRAVDTIRRLQREEP